MKTNLRLITFQEQTVLNTVDNKGVYYAARNTTEQFKAIGGYTGVKCFIVPTPMNTKDWYTGEVFEKCAKALGITKLKLTKLKMIEIEVKADIVTQTDFKDLVVIPFLVKDWVVQEYSLDTRFTLTTKGTPEPQINVYVSRTYNFNITPILADGFQTLTIPECIAHLSEISTKAPLNGFNVKGHLSEDLARKYLSQRITRRELIMAI